MSSPRSLSPRSDSPAPKLRKPRVQSERSVKSFAQLREQTLKNFVAAPNQNDLIRAQNAYTRLGEQEKQGQLGRQVSAILDWIERAQDLYNATVGKDRFSKEESALATKLLNESPVPVPILYDDRVAEQLDKVSESGARRSRPLKLIAEVEKFLIDNPDPDQDQKLELLSKLEEAKQSRNPEVLQEVQRLSEFLAEESQGVVLDPYSQPFYKSYQRLMDKLAGQQSFVAAEQARYWEEAREITREMENFINANNIQGLELQQLADLNDAMYRKIDSIPIRQVQRRQAPVEFPLLSVDELKSDSQVRSLLRKYSDQWSNPDATQVQKDNITKNLSAISEYVRQRQDIYLKGYLDTVLQQVGLTLYQPQDFRELRDAIDKLEWPDREDFEVELESYLQMVQNNFEQILNQVPFFLEAFERFTRNTTNPEKSSCVANKQLDLHQLFAIAWFYCNGSTGVFNFFSTGGGKTAAAWATLRMYRDQVKVGNPNSVKLIWVTLDNLIKDAWKDSWAYSDIMIGYEPGKATPEQVAERARIEKEVWFVTYKIFDGLIRKAHGTNKTQVETRYGIKIGDQLLPTQLNNAKIIIDEAQYLVEPPKSAKTYGVKYDTIMDFFSQSYKALPLQQRPKLCVLSATPSVTTVEATPKLLNLLIHDVDYRLPATEEGVKQQFANGEWAGDNLYEWQQLTRGLTVCYDGHGDKSLFAQKHVNPMIVVRGNEGQLQAIEQCKKDQKCKRAKVEYVAVEKDGSDYTLPATVNPVSSQFSIDQAEDKLFKAQPAVPLPKPVPKRVVKK